MRFYSFLALGALLGGSPNLHSTEIDLSTYEKGIHSQNGEDGVIEKIFEVIGMNTRFYVELGAYDGHCWTNTKQLRESGWMGVLLDWRKENPELNLHKEVINPETVNQLFVNYEIPFDFDLLSIDLDCNDFYVWNALADSYRPRVVVVEYNASHGFNEDKVVAYDVNNAWDGTNNYGASLLAFYQLGLKKGYSLVYAESKGVNLFFVRNDLLARTATTFKNINDVEKLYRVPTYGSGPNGGHRADPKNRPYIESKSIL